MNAFTGKTRLPLIFLLLSGLLFLSGCGSKKVTIDRNFAIPENTSKGYIYGKLGHYNKFGQKFKITFKNRKNGDFAELMVSLFSSDPGEWNFLAELEPGEYLLHQIVPESGTPIDIPNLEKDEHREFFVESGKLSYVGSWLFTEGKLEVLDDKLAQDEYMKSNYKYVSTSIALPTLP